MTTTILDVSAAQGVIEWATLAAAGRCDGVICKATEGAGPYVDPQFDANFSGAARNALLLGTYHYAHPDESLDDAAIEARHYVSSVLKRAKANDWTAPLLYALDIENARRIRKGPPFVAWCRAFVETIEAMTSLTCWVYTGGPFWDENDGDIDAESAAFFAARPLWIAAYVTDPAKWVKMTPWRVVGHALHQWAGDVQPGGKPGIRYPGIAGNVVDTNRYDGTFAALRGLIGRGAGARDTEPAPAPSSGPPTWPQTPTSKSSQRLRAVRPEEWSPQTSAHTVLPDIVPAIEDEVDTGGEGDS